MTEKSAPIHVDRGARPLTFADTGGEPILFYDANVSKYVTDADGRPTTIGWTLRVEYFHPFVMGVRDPDAQDLALEKATSYLEMPLPTGSRLPGRSVELQRLRLDNGSRLNLDAMLYPDGTLEISGQDFGPVTRGMSPDGEYEWSYTFAPADVPRLVVALGGDEDTDPLDLLARSWSGNAASGLGETIRSSGVRYRFANYS